MIDREKVIVGLRHCIEKLDTIINKSHGFNCIKCPYYDACNTVGSLVGLPLLYDVLKLLDVQSDLDEYYGLQPGGAAYALEQYQELLQTITRNRMSKLTYSAEDILECARDLYYEPRIMCLEEVMELPADSGMTTPVWLETRIVTDKGAFTDFHASILWSVGNGRWRQFKYENLEWEDIRAKDYYATWRCWTPCPTDEQREAVKWDAAD